jgi:hypothetical protein
VFYLCEVSRNVEQKRWKPAGAGLYGPQLHITE